MLFFLIFPLGRYCAHSEIIQTNWRVLFVSLLQLITTLSLLFLLHYPFVQYNTVFKCSYLQLNNAFLVNVNRDLTSHFILDSFYKTSKLTIFPFLSMFKVQRIVSKQLNYIIMGFIQCYFMFSFSKAISSKTSTNI